MSVNPPVLQRVRATLPQLRVVGEDVPLPLAVHYAECGADRVLGVAGALHRRPDADAVLVLDAGTCLTATLGVRAEGVVGGAIAPGPELMAQALSSGTAELPHVAPHAPTDFIGRNTADAIRSGVWAAYLGAARELVRRCVDEYGGPVDVVAIGHGAGALAAQLPEVCAVHPFATLWGVYIAIGIG